MPSSPIISISRSSGGQAVARGVLIAGTKDSVIGAAGLFSPWSESLTEGAEFSIYVPGSDGQPEECLQPKQLGILDLSREEHATYCVVSFVEEPTNVSFQPATTQQHHPVTGKWLEAMESERASELKQLRTRYVRSDPGTHTAAHESGKAGKCTYSHDGHSRHVICVQICSSMGLGVKHHHKMLVRKAHASHFLPSIRPVMVFWVRKPA